jgi:hypothetical protein
MVMVCLVASCFLPVRCACLVPTLFLSSVLQSAHVLPCPDTTCWAALALVSPFFATIAARVKARRLSLFLVLASFVARAAFCSNPFSNALAASCCSPHPTKMRKGVAVPGSGSNNCLAAPAPYVLNLNTNNFCFSALTTVRQAGNVVLTSNRAQYISNTTPKCPS